MLFTTKINVTAKCIIFFLTIFISFITFFLKIKNFIKLILIKILLLLKRSF